MASIGGVSCLYVRGHIPSYTERVKRWEVAGLNGYGAKRQGLRGAEFTVEAEWKGTSTECDVFLLALEALVGQVVTITNDWGDTFLYCLIESLGDPRKTAEVRYGGAAIKVPIKGVRK